MNKIQTKINRFEGLVSFLLESHRHGQAHHANIGNRAVDKWEAENGDHGHAQAKWIENSSGVCTREDVASDELVADSSEDDCNYGAG
jgi:hypothetical protein